jgi:predicted MFS family arabinose efflux permease
MSQDIRAYSAVTAAYWAFTLTDGALRMLVLLHFHAAGFSPVDLAFLFLLYEVMGIVTNLAGGWVGARFGLRLTLFSGLVLQVAALLALSLVNPDWGLALSVAWVMAAQALSGVAKDLTKMSSKSAVKVVVKDGSAQRGLFRWVALLTGSKNALKGVGFFLGGVLLETLGFQGSLWAMAAMLLCVLLAVALFLRHPLGKASGKPKARALFTAPARVNWLALARLFLFGSRDIWFVVGVPVFLSASLGWGAETVGAFMALWVIGYGIVQALVPSVLRSVTGIAAASRAALLWVLLLALLTGALAVLISSWGDGLVLVVGLMGFGVIFALNSALHSYLVVAFADDTQVSMTVGFYYSANAVGRLLGTLASGLAFQWGGVEATLWGAFLFVVLAALCTLPVMRLSTRAEQGQTG